MPHDVIDQSLQQRTSLPLAQLEAERTTWAKTAAFPAGGHAGSAAFVPSGFGAMPPPGLRWNS